MKTVVRGLASALSRAVPAGLTPRDSASAASYTWPVTLSVLMHGLVLAVLVIGWSPPEQQRKVVTPRHIEAQLLQMEAPLVQAPAEQPRVDTAAQERERREREEAQRREQQRQEQQRQEQQRQEAVRQEQARQEQLRREQEQRAEAERKRQEEAERQRQEEQKRQQAERERQERERQEQQRREQEAREAQARAAQAQADAEAREERVGTYMGYIQSRVASNWSRPPSARLGMVTELEIALDGQARVVGVSVIKSSGNSAFDLSAEQAVRRVEQFDRLRELIQQDRAAYEQNFRRFRLVFNPQDLRQ